MIDDSGPGPFLPSSDADLKARVAAELKSGKTEHDVILDLVRDGSVRNVAEAEALIAAAKGSSVAASTSRRGSDQWQSSTGSAGAAPRRSGSRLRVLVGAAAMVATMALLYFFGGSHGTSLIFIPVFVGLRFLSLGSRGRGRRGGGPWTV